MNLRSEKISFIIPCFNEEGNICACVSAIAKQYPDSEIVIVNDGSTDGSSRAISELGAQINNITLIEFSRNMGKSKAVAEGIKRCRGEYIVLFDADISVSVEDVKLFCEAVVCDNVEFAYGSRFHLSPESKAISRMNLAGNKISAFLLSFITGLKIKDVLCGTKAFKKEHFRDVVFKNRRWPDFDLFLHACKNRLNIREMPVIYRCRRQGASKMKFMDAFLFAADIFNAFKQLRGPCLLPGKQIRLK